MVSHHFNMYKVCISCFTYNQARYIVDTMNGFVMQETDFPFVATIVDDASTDDAPQVISRYFEEYFDINDSSTAFQEETDYGKVLFARHSINKNCYFAIVLLNENHYQRKKRKTLYLSRWRDNAEYIAPCEGDDYWTDPLKLQTQVEFLDGHGEYSLCCHRYRIFNQRSGSWEKDYVHALFDKHPEGFSFTRSDNLKTWITKTMTLMYRRDWLIEEEFQGYKYRCDEHLNYHLLSHGPGYCLPFVGAVYRRTDSGVFASLPEKAKRMRGVLIRSELLSHNLKDCDLKENVFFLIKKCLNKNCSLKGMMTPISICLKSYYLTDGFTATLRVAKKLLSSYIKGVFARIRVK